jgi:hypothetical protein
MVSKLESVAIRRAEREDLAALEAVHLAAISGTSVSAARPVDWQGYLSSSRHFIYLAEDERPFGFVCAGEPDTALSSEHQGEILAWYMMPTHWHHGMGRKLLVRGLSVLKRRHFDSAFMWMADNADRAREVALSIGFEPLEAKRTSNLPGGELSETAYHKSLGEFF